MSDPLLIPATADLLEGWTGPVLVDDGRDDLLPCVCLGVTHEREGWVALGELAIRPGQPVVDALQRPMSDVHLDLRRAEVRDRCARVLANRVGAAGHCWHRVSPRRWDLSDWTFWELPARCHEATLVPALADLNPADDTRLPDGSRRVDALALAAVVRQVVSDV